MSDRTIRDFNVIKLTPRPKFAPKKPTSTNFSQFKNIKSKIDNEEIKLSTISAEMSKSIKNARAEKNLSQVDLAKRCNLAKDRIRDYENGKATPIRGELVIINNVLGLNLKMPKPIKIVDTSM